MNIAFTGYYGMGNYGDDLFVVAATYGATKYWSERPNIISKKIKKVNADFTVHKFEKIYTSGNILGNLYRAGHMISAFKKNDIIILAGGSTISSNTSNRMRNLQFNLLKKGISKMAAVGVSVGPFNNIQDRENARHLINSFEYISVRDESSYKILEEMNVQTPYIMGRDIAGVIPLVGREKSKKQDNVVTLGVSLCNYETYTNGDLNQERTRNIAMIKGIKDYAIIMKENIVVKICVLNTDKSIGDMNISQMLVEELEAEGIKFEVKIHQDNPIEMYDQIASCDIFFSVRLHGAISAYLENVPFALVEYHEKCSAFLNDIEYNSRFRINANISEAIQITNILFDLQRNKEKLYLYKPSSYINDAIQTFNNAPWVKS